MEEKLEIVFLDELEDQTITKETNQLTTEKKENKMKKSNTQLRFKSFNLPKKEFARLQIQKMRDMGYSQHESENILRGASPSKCVQACLWAQECIRTVIAIFYKEDCSMINTLDPKDEYEYMFREAKMERDAHSRATEWAKIVLECILSKADGPDRYNWERMARTLSAFGIEMPDAETQYGVWQIIRGARIAIRYHY